MQSYTSLAPLWLNKTEFDYVNLYFKQHLGDFLHIYLFLKHAFDTVFYVLVKLRRFNTLYE